MTIALILAALAIAAIWATIVPLAIRARRQERIQRIGESMLAVAVATSGVASALTQAIEGAQRMADNWAALTNHLDNFDAAAALDELNAHARKDT